MENKNSKENKSDLMEKVVSLCKRRGFVFAGSEIYGGLAGTWDFGPYGAELSNNIKDLWWKKFISNRDDMYGIDAAIIMNPKAWEASGHVSGFSDPLSECVKCKHRFRADHLEDQKNCPDCGGTLSSPKQFNMMFKTNVGAMEDASSIAYLRPETAGGMFVNFKNILDSMHPKLPFGMGQIGKAFRNEIAPRDFIFRSREFKQMEIEYFVDPRDERKVMEIFDKWHNEQIDFLKEIGLDENKLHKIEVPESDRAHYSKRSVDIEFDFPFGQKELLGLAYRTDFDLKNHSSYSGTDLSYFDEETKERFTPHCIEPTFGLERLFLAVLSNAYTEEVNEGDTRILLKLSPKLAPVKCAVFPLLKNKPELVEKAKEVYSELKKEFRCEFDDNGNIGKRYRRQDEIGTPFCVTVDFDTIEKDGSLTIRYRDSGEQERKTLEEIKEIIRRSLI
jgi:glycyl-tRNA synthetase